MESLRGLESHRTSGDVKFTPEGKEVISQMGTFPCNYPSCYIGGHEDSIVVVQL